MPHLHADDVHKWYGETETGYHALRGVSFELEKGEFAALRGPSGCGKSTLLHIAGAMDRSTSGKVTLGGVHLEGLSSRRLAETRRRSIGFVFQQFNLLPTLTAIENVALPLLLDGIPSSRANRKADAALDEVGLASKRQSFPSQLSGGEMQRVAIARAVAIEPELLIADEPTGSLDSENGRRVLELLSRLNRDRNLTILMATHSADAAGYAQSVRHLRDGVLVDGEHTASAAAVGPSETDPSHAAAPAV
ncbi:MAG: ABC transporter ATP-binding protein [Planctomycetota bacterium]